MARRRKKKDVIHLNAFFEPIGWLPFNDALTDIVLGKVWSYAPDKESFAQGPPQPDGSRLQIPWPFLVVQKKAVSIDPKKTKPINTVLATRYEILKRDDFTCQYCLEDASTIDHVYPQWKGGENTWYNLVAACIRCNTAKAGLTLDEMTKLSQEELEQIGLSAPLKLKRTPFVPNPDKYAKVREEVLRLLETGELDDIGEDI